MAIQHFHILFSLNISSRDKETAAEFLAGTAELAVPSHKTQPQDSFAIYIS